MKLKNWLASVLLLITAMLTTTFAHQITHVRLYDANAHLLQALSNTSIDVIVGVTNEEVLRIGESPSAAAAWINKNVVAYVPSTNIMAIAVGSEVLSTIPNVVPVLVPALNSLHKALVAANLNFRVKVSTPSNSSKPLQSSPLQPTFFFPFALFSQPPPSHDASPPSVSQSPPSPSTVPPPPTLPSTLTSGPAATPTNETVHGDSPIVPFPSIPSVNGSDNIATNNAPSYSGGLNTGAAVTIGVVVSLIVLSLLGIAVFFVQKKKKGKGSRSDYAAPSPYTSSHNSGQYLALSKVILYQKSKYYSTSSFIWAFPLF
ncbi:unnamed protein product [Vicia faba]|uniref:glucan endo-1,3-beta-D-glucosidase n=1 Tax=Vicia faba TaxID=3906 RepID=A0AAV1BE31_VICFA|nr:unnamed protein product [Vicia faba]